MPVVINDFEVVADGPQPEGRGAGGSDSGGGGGGEQPPKPEDVERALRTQMERAERVWAH